MNRISLLALPAVVLIAATVGLPVLVLLFQSFGPFGTAQLSFEGLGLHNYIRLLTTPFYLESILRTLVLSALVVLICLPAGLVLAVEFVRARGMRKAFLSLLILSPLLVSVIIRNLGWILILGPNSPTFDVMRIIDPAASPRGLQFTEIAVVLGLAHVMLPFVVLPTSAALQNLDGNVVSAGRTLGAGPWHVLRHVILPSAWPGLVAGGTLAFVLSASYYITPALLGGPQIPMLSSIIFGAGVGSANWTFASAAAVLLLMISMLIVYSITRRNRSVVASMGVA